MVETRFIWWWDLSSSRTSLYGSRSFQVMPLFFCSSSWSTLTFLCLPWALEPASYSQRLQYPADKSGLWVGVAEVYDAVCCICVSSRPCTGRPQGILAIMLGHGLRQIQWRPFSFFISPLLYLSPLPEGHGLCIPKWPWKAGGCISGVLLDSWLCKGQTSTPGETEIAGSQVDRDPLGFRIPGFHCWVAPPCFPCTY